MLTPQTLSRIPDPIVDLINELQMEIIQSIAAKLTKADYLTPSAEWQLYKAQQLRLSTADVNKLLAKYTKLSKREISKLYTEACKEAINNDAKIYRMYGKDASSFTRSVAFSNALKAGIRNTNGLMSNFTRSMVQSSRKTVTHLMDKAYVKVLSGAFSPQEAIYSAVKALADLGIQSVTYPSGRTDWADVAVRRAVLTGLNQTTGRLQLDLAEEMDCDLVEVNSHSDARPSHAEWQGQVYSLSGKHKKYPDFYKSTGYGTGDGLMGWNCRHNFYPFFEGISERASFPVDKEENKEAYELSQKQRSMERAIRKSKRGLAALDSSIKSTDDPELKDKLQRDFDRKSNTLKKQEARLDDFCKANDLLIRNDRTRVVGFGRSVSQKAVHGSKRYSAKKSSGGGSSVSAKSKAAKSRSKPLKDSAAEEKSVDYMSKSFRPEYSTTTNNLDVDGKTITTKAVKNSSFDIVTDVDATRRNKAVRLTEQLLGELQEQFPEGFTLPKVAVVDFDKHGLNPDAIGGFHAKSGVMYINSKYDTRSKILEYVNANKGFFANTTEHAPILHELGHKYYEDSVKALAKSQNIEYNKAKGIIDSRIQEYLHHKVPKRLGESLSTYADLGYKQHKYTEIIAEAFSVNQSNDIAKDLLSLLNGVIN